VGTTDGRSAVCDEFYLESADAVVHRWPLELWIAKGRPKLWVKLYENEGITLWRDYGFGRIKLKTPEGIDEGEEIASVNSTLAVWRNRRLELYVGESKHRTQINDLLRLERDDEDDTLQLELEAELVISEFGN
jgi:hypothetical protein